MRLALISDTHNHFDHVQRAVEYLHATHIDIVLHAGDVTSSQTLELFTEFNVWIAQGNMDNEKDLAGLSTTLFGEGRFAPMHDLEFNGCKVALLHGHDRQLLDGLIYAKHYDYVIRGHTHAPGDRCVQTTRVLNPGAVGNTGWRTSSFGILDLHSGELDYVRL
jgi:hypothetical protein